MQVDVPVIAEQDKGIQMVFSRCASHFRLDELESRMCPSISALVTGSSQKHFEHGRNAWELHSHNHRNYADIDSIESMVHNCWTQLIHNR